MSDMATEREPQTPEPDAAPMETQPDPVPPPYAPDPRLIDVMERGERPSDRAGSEPTRRDGSS